MFLDSNCTYNDDKGIHYEGKKSVTKLGRKCRYWQAQFRYGTQKSHFVTNNINNSYDILDLLNLLPEIKDFVYPPIICWIHPSLQQSDPIT